mgnify:CR=1 FL=1
MKKILFLLVMLFGVISITVAQSSTHYYQKAQESERQYEYYKRKGDAAMHNAESYRRSAINARTASGARDFSYTADRFQREANEHYQRAQRYAQEAANYRRDADRLARQGR